MYLVEISIQDERERQRERVGTEWKRRRRMRPTCSGGAIQLLLIVFCAFLELARGQPDYDLGKIEGESGRRDSIWEGFDEAAQRVCCGRSPPSCRDDTGCSGHGRCLPHVSSSLPLRMLCITVLSEDGCASYFNKAISRHSHILPPRMSHTHEQSHSFVFGDLLICLC